MLWQHGVQLIPDVAQHRVYRVHALRMLKQGCNSDSSDGYWCTLAFCLQALQHCAGVVTLAPAAWELTSSCTTCRAKDIVRLHEKTGRNRSASSAGVDREPTTLTSSNQWPSAASSPDRCTVLALSLAMARNGTHRAVDIDSGSVAVAGGAAGAARAADAGAVLLQRALSAAALQAV